MTALGTDAAYIWPGSTIGRATDVHRMLMSINSMPCELQILPPLPTQRDLALHERLSALALLASSAAACLHPRTARASTARPPPQSATGEQRHTWAGDSRARARKRKSAEQTIGEAAWRTVGRRDGGHGKRSLSGNGDPGRRRPDRGPPQVKHGAHVMLGRVARGWCFATSHGRCGFNAKSFPSSGATTDSRR